jgi:hypothetical protein
MRGDLEGAIFFLRKCKTWVSYTIFAFLWQVTWRDG